MVRQVGWVCALVWLLTACGGPPGVRSDVGSGDIQVVWETKILADHPLSGRLWSTRKGAFASSTELVAALQSAPVILVGERHDHPDHHRLQGWLLSRLPANAVVGFEMLDELDQEPIAQVTSADTLRDASKWGASGWPDFEIYRPVFAAAYATGQTVAAVHPSRARLRALMTGPASQATENQTLADALSPAGLAALRRDITKGHCGHASPPIVDAMVMAQRFKDRWMTARLREAAGQNPAVLIAGNGHIRRDYGVPNEHAEPVMSVALLEVRRDVFAPQEYETDLYDWVWFTPRVDEIDPCEKFKTQLERIRKSVKKKAAK